MNQSLHEDARLRNCRPTLLEPLQQPHGYTPPRKTHAESPLPDTKHQVKKYLPRASGGGPRMQNDPLIDPRSSPRERGWSPGARPRRRRPGIFPARAGVVPPGRRARRRHRDLPRASGGGPSSTATRLSFVPSSPRERGWSRVDDALRARRVIFPARAGVVPSGARSTATGTYLPRASGGGPAPITGTVCRPGSSPRERGWSQRERPVVDAVPIFPARAGVVRARVPGGADADDLPRASGGGPLVGARAVGDPESSPRERGWSPVAGVLAELVVVFPARAGVVHW